MTRQDKRAALLMSIGLLLLFVAFGSGLFIGMTVAPQYSTSAPTREVTATTFDVTRIIDGDTLDVGGAPLLVLHTTAQTPPLVPAST